MTHFGRLITALGRAGRAGRVAICPAVFAGGRGTGLGGSVCG
ncbi:hypothetical protein [Kineosporia succinea]|uniref:Uncharacterized protein n=1 Tax=Kineosporia succinea TaxID=84632 RepID=A0ABT9P6Y2_9ACTN|nr:hypothetical protein [Kineosporia succinea]MDP9828441.1 hypothetical protein [Kineosporia succinea]